jgi:hypothetical protein
MAKMDTSNMSKEEFLELHDGQPSPEEKALLDHELEEYRKNPEAGSTWNEVEAQLRKTPLPIISQTYPD